MKNKQFLLHTFFPLMAIALSMASCTPGSSMKVSISNTNDRAVECETIEIPASNIAEVLGKGNYIVYVNGKEVPSQFTYDSLLIFQTDIPANGTAECEIILSDTVPVYDNITVGRIYPERADDLAWENDLVGFRAYGPATQARGEKAFGYDIFFKHPNKRPVLEDLYGAQTSSANWHIVDSLKAISKEQAKDFENSFTYHIDHGQGMDCYAVGATLGDGVAARVVNDSIVFPWCYDTAEILDNGPLRFTAKLTFAPVNGITETRTISLDAGKHLNSCTVSYAGLNDSTEIVAGVPRRDDSEAIFGDNFIAYADPTQGKDNGKALLGVLVPDRENAAEEREGHIVLRSTIAPGENYRYYFGFAWDRTDITDMDEWTEYIKTFKNPPLTLLYQN